jgi:hypothetical protein
MCISGAFQKSSRRSRSAAGDSEVTFPVLGRFCSICVRPELSIRINWQKTSVSYPVTAFCIFTLDSSILRSECCIVSMEYSVLRVEFCILRVEFSILRVEFSIFWFSLQNSFSLTFRIQISYRDSISQGIPHRFPLFLQERYLGHQLNCGYLICWLISISLSL